MFYLLKIMLMNVFKSIIKLTLQKHLLVLTDNMQIDLDKILIIQTSFIGDVILATPIIEALYNKTNKPIDILVRKGNESLFREHPKVNKVWTWNKKSNKISNQIKLINQIRKEKYDLVINLQRFLSSGLFSTLSRAKIIIGFNKNPLSFLFTHSIAHKIEKGIHETERNLSLLQPIFGKVTAPMKLYPNNIDFDVTRKYKQQDYIVIAPTSVWFTKQYPAEKWVDFINFIPNNYNIYLIGGAEDYNKINKTLIKKTKRNCVNLCGKLSLLQSTALMKDAKMCYVNDSAPMHLASSVNAPITAVFCSTVIDFGFGPKSSQSFIVETKEELSCRPCGLHGRKECPKGHFKCANNIDTKQLLFSLNDDGKRN